LGSSEQRKRQYFYLKTNETFEEELREEFNLHLREVGF
jgi:hypothetical protein